ncbi:hypothetical protein A2U01_0017831, partial [Trifolium medium]|nr:hypothetical protein [Trifolium medium]
SVAVKPVKRPLVGSSATSPPLASVSISPRPFLDDATLRERYVLKRLRESEMQVKALTSKVSSYTCHDLDLLLGRIAELDDEVCSLRSQLHVFSYSDFYENWAKVTELTTENTSLKSDLSECIRRALGAYAVSFRNALDQVDLYLGWALPRDMFDPESRVRRGKLVPYARPV